MNCDRVARLYRWMEYAVFGLSLERARAALLGHVREAHRVLTLGDGDGRALAMLVRAAPAAHIDTVDASARMLWLARARVQSERVRFHHADARCARFAQGEYDAIVTHFFFDCFDRQDLPAVIAKAAEAAAPRARWLVSEFRPATRGARLLIATMYTFFAIATGLRTRRLVDHHEFLQRHGFRLQQAEHRWAGMIASELWIR